MISDLRRSALGARPVEYLNAQCDTKKHERFEDLEILLTLVDRALELAHLGLGDAPHALVLGVRRRRQLAAEIEELVLQPLEDLDQPSAGIAVLLGGERAHDAEHGVELVDR